MTIEQEALDEAVKAAGYEDWCRVDEELSLITKDSIRAHAQTIMQLNTERNLLAAVKADVSEDMAHARDVIVSLGGGNLDDTLARLSKHILPTPDPLKEVVADAVTSMASGDKLHEGLRAAAERLGYTLKLERLDQ